MFCQSCLEKVCDKLILNDIAILEYLNEKQADIRQCSISREVIKQKLDMTIHNCRTSLDKLYYLSLIEQTKSKPSKYFITEDGKCALELLNKKLERVD